MTILFPKHKAGLTLEHQPHKPYYDTAVVWCEDNRDNYDWASDEAKARAIATDQIFTLHWYPDTPVGSYAVAAPSLEEVLEFALTYPGAK